MTIAVLLQPWIDQWAIHLFSSAWQAAVVATIVLAIDHWLPLPARVRWLFFVLALLKFAMPPMLAFPTGAFSALPPRGGGLAPTSESWLGWMFAIYFAGVTIAVVRLIHEWLQLRALLRSSLSVAEGPAIDATMEIRGLLRITRPVGLRTSTEIVVPFATGVLRPTIILPSSLLHGPSDLRNVLAHELAHIARGDVLLNWAASLLSVIWWFHPLLPAVRRGVRVAAEECCDDLAVSLKGMSADGYRRSLLAVAERASQKTYGWAAAMATEAESLSRRIVRLGCPPHPARRWHVALLIASTALLLPGIRIAADRLVPRIEVKAVDASTVSDHQARHAARHHHSH